MKDRYNIYKVVNDYAGADPGSQDEQTFSEDLSSAHPRIMDGFKFSKKKHQLYKQECRVKPPSDREF